MLGLDGGWRAGLEEAGIAVDDNPGRGHPLPDLAVAPVSCAHDAIATGAPMVVLEGRGGRKALRGRFARIRRYLPVPSVESPHLILALDDRQAAVYALDHWSLPRSRRKRLRNRAAHQLIMRGILPEARPVITVGTNCPDPPLLIRAAEPCGVPAGAGWYLTLGGGDVLSRGVFHLFPSDSQEPSWVLKFSRIPGYRTPFDRDERGLGLAREAGGIVSSHAPRFLGRFDVDGIHASVETAAEGRRFTQTLLGAGSRSEKLDAIDGVAEWLIAMGKQTQAPSELLEPERRRMAEEVIPYWQAEGIEPSLVAEVPAVAAVLQHNDVGTWNIVDGARGFTVVDWEAARSHGFPLWDLAYFLVDALLHLDGADAEEQRDAHNLSLFRGQTPSSSVLFTWLRRAAEAFDVPSRAVGPLVTLGWLHHGLSHLPRGQDLTSHARTSPRPGLADAARIARLWLDYIGPDWSAWRRV